MDWSQPPDTVQVRLNRTLDHGWQCRLNQDGRLYYLNHKNETAHWIPPRPNWPSGGLPYGWESATDKNGKDYYINHRTCTTTREDPFDLEEAPPQERDVVLFRDAALGFGFIAGSEKPVVVRSVTEGGPSIGKLLPGDEVLKVNGEDVKNSNRQYIIDKIRYSTDEIALTVIQPYVDKTGLKSSFLSATKKQKLKAKPPRVRFAENVHAFPSNSPKIPPSLVYLPNVLKVYLENGQTKSFKYDDDTTVKDVLVNLQEKLGLKSLAFFALAVEDVRTPSEHKYLVLQEHEPLRQIAERPGSQNWKCHLRVFYLPSDAYDLLSDDPTSFDYFYNQCCNDVLQERFASELKPDTAIRLAALHIHQHLLANKQTTKVSIKTIEKEDGLERFVPGSVLSNWKTKELRKLITQHMKHNQSLAAPGHKTLTELQAKLHYLRIVGEIKSFGTMKFVTTILDFPDVDQQSDATVVIGPRCDISLQAKTGDHSPLLPFDQLTRILLTVESGTEDGVHRVELHQKSGQPIVFLLPSEDAQQMAGFVNGMYRLLINKNRTLLTETDFCLPDRAQEARAYNGIHHVQPAKWNYPDDLASEVISDEVNCNGSSKVKKVREGEHWVDLSRGPPPYEADLSFLKSSELNNRLPVVEEENQEVAEEVQNPSQDDMDESEIQEYPEDPEDASPLSEDSQISVDSQLSDERWDSEREEGILSLLSSGASSPESETKDMLGSGEGKQKRDADGNTASRKRDKSLTEGISKKIFRSITGMKFNIKDTVASNDSENVSATDVKFLRYSPTPYTERSDEVKIKEESVGENSDRKEEKLEGNEERPGSRLRARDSILIQHRKMSPMMQRREDVNDNQDSHSDDDDGHSKSFDSDVIDLTIIGDYDFDSDLSPTKSVPDGAGSDDNDDVFDDEAKVEEEEEIDDMQGIEELLQAVTSNTNQYNDSVEITDDSKTLSVESDDEDLDIPDIGEDDDEPVIERFSEDQVHVTIGEEQDDDIDDGDEIPISSIDCVSPEPDMRSRELLSDEAHGMQLAALVALDASLEEAEESINAASQCTYTECESDSGNETISSEIDSNNADHQPFSHQLKDSVRIVMTPALEHSHDAVTECRGRGSVSISEEDTLEPYSVISGCTTSSDTESTSTLHGSSPNLSAIDIGDEKVSSEPSKDATAKAQSPGERSGEQQEQPENVCTNVVDLDALIATLIVPPPPPLETGEIDEELLKAILPPPPLEGFDEGTFDDIIPQTIPPELDGDGFPEMDVPISEVGSSDLMLGAEQSVDDRQMDSHVDSAPLNEGTISSELDSHVEETLSCTEVEIKHTSEEEKIENLEVCSQISDGKEDNDEIDFASDICDEEAELRELLELTVIGDDLKHDMQEQTDNGHVEIKNDGMESPADDILKIIEGDNTDMFEEELRIVETHPCSLDPKESDRGDPFEEDLRIVEAQLSSPDLNESDHDDLEADAEEIQVHYDSYGRMRGHKSPEQKVADILDAIITDSLSSGETISSPGVVDEPGASRDRDPVKLHGIHQSSLQGSVDSGFHQPDQELLSLTSTPTELVSPKSFELSSTKMEPTQEDTFIDVPVTIPTAQVQESPQEQKVQTQASSSQAVRPKHIGKKPNIPPKPAKPARPKDLQLKLNAISASKRPSVKGPAPQPPPRKRHTAPGIAAKASRFESYSDSKSDGYATLPKSFSPPVQSEYNDSANAHDSRFDFKSSLSVQESDSRTAEVKTRKPVARSHTFSDSSPTKDSNKLYPVRKAPPPPLPKPKFGKSSQGGEKTSKVSGSSSASNSPHLSVNRKSFTGSLSKLLSPNRNKTWGQLKDSFPFKQGNGGSSRSKSKSRKPLKALWPSATCDSPRESENNNSIEVNGSNNNNDNSQLTVGRFQRSESVEFEVNRDLNVERRLRSFSLNTRTYSEDSTSESDFDTPTGSPSLKHTGFSKGRPSSMIVLTDSYPPALGQPRRPPPPRPSNPPVMKAASLSRLSSKVYDSDPIRPIPRVPMDSTPGTNPGGDGTDPTSPPPLPGTKPPERVSHEQESMSADDQNEYNHNSEGDVSFIDAVQSKEYAGVTAICNAITDINILVGYMNDCTVNLRSEPNVRQFRQAKESLLAEVREFTSNTKMVVSAAGQAGPELRESTSSSMHTLARLCSATQASMAVMTSPAQAQNLGKKVEDVAKNFSGTLQAANEAHGKALSDTKMQQLLRKAQTMAALLSALMRSLRMLQH